jgi:hypothetical protein
MKTKLGKTVMNLLFLMAGYSFKSHGAVHVVASKNFPENTLQVETIKEAFLGRKPSIRSGVSIRAIDRADNDQRFRGAFLKAILGWNTTRYKAYWSQIVFTGKGEALPVVKSLTELEKILNESKGSISFVDDSEKTGDFKILLSVETES